MEEKQSDKDALIKIIKTIWIRLAQGAAIFFAGWFVNYLSLSGVNFQTHGIDSELVKQGLVYSVFIALTCPREFAHLLRIAIHNLRSLCHDVCSDIKSGLNEPIEEENEKNP